jgi:hypothetical protein
VNLQAGKEPKEVVGQIEGGEELTVARRQGEVWIDRILPEDALSPETAVEVDDD